MQKSQGGAGWPGRLATCRHGTGRSTEAVWTEAGRCRSTGPWWTEARRVGCARRGSARPRRRAMAGSGELAAAALRDTGSDSEGTGVLATARRARCARLRGQEAAMEAGARGGAAQRRRRNYGEGAHATEREGEREEHRRIPHLNAKLGGRSSLPETLRQRRSSSAARAPRCGKGGGAARVLGWRRCPRAPREACGRRPGALK